MNRIILKRQHPDGNNFEIDVTDCSFMEFMSIIKDKAKLGGVMAIVNDDFRFIVDNRKFFGNLK